MVVFTKHGLRLKVLSIPITLPFGPVQLDFISSSCLSEYAITLGGVFGVRNISYTFFPVLAHVKNAKYFVCNIEKWKFFVVYPLGFSVYFVSYLYGTGSVD